jgi:hypothetical protein
VQTGTTDLASLEGALNKEKNKEKVIA